MVKLNRIYTRTGDRGTAVLADGSRIAKNDARFAAIGDVDETNSVIGVARLHVAQSGDPGLDATLEAVQNDLFDLGADLAVPDPRTEGALRIVADQVRWLEARIDALNGPLAPLSSFVLPGGCAAAAHLHVARAVCRRAERSVVALAEAEGFVNPHAMAYMNRLSDLLFVAARHLNARAGGDVRWTPGEGRRR